MRRPSVSWKAATLPSSASSISWSRLFSWTSPPRAVMYSTNGAHRRSGGAPVTRHDSHITATNTHEVCRSGADAL